MTTSDQRAAYIAKLEERWQNLTIKDDTMFGMVMENQEICLELLRRIFPELNIVSVKQLETQKEAKGPLSARTVRFDVFVRDQQQRTFVIEMQVANRHNLPYRLRYYQHQIDFDILNVGDSYQKLADYPTYVIMFCDFDYFECGQVKYCFENRSVNDDGLSLQDGRKIIVFNAKASDFHDNIKVEGFLKLMNNQVDDHDKLVARIDEEMRRIKEDPQRRHGFMKYELDLMDARADGKAEGKAEGLKQGIEQGKKQEAEHGIITNIRSLQKFHVSRDQIIEQLMKNYDLTPTSAQKYYNEYAR